MFLLKKIVAPFFFPLTFSLGIILAGLILLWFTPRKRAGKVALTAGAALLLVLSYGPVPDLLLRPLEYRYPPILHPEELSQVRWIVVLGGGHTSDPTIPPTSRISSSALVRLVEGIRIHRALPGSRLVLSGGVVFDPVPEAETMAEVAVLLGVARQNLVLESDSKDTEEEARFIRGIVAESPFVLVTSASHMPRSMALFRKMGLRPIPAPTHYKIKERQGEKISPGAFFPSLGGLDKAETAIYEYLGLAWSKLRGKA
ncbi:MAG: envelope biogenesis factor ElyC [Deltaproteobacteria bacterium]|nr:envelope biogenesis factor ElyC [Deltaproteobacteria bacterium]